MARFFSNLFSQLRFSYVYGLTEQEVKARIAETFHRSGGFFIGPDINGKFIGPNQFVMNMQTVGFMYGANLFYSALYGTLQEKQTGKTTIDIHIVPSIFYKFFFILVLLFGFSFFFAAVRNASFQFLIWGVAFAVLGPFLVNWFAGISTAALQDRYERYVHEAIKSLRIA